MIYFAIAGSLVAFATIVIIFVDDIFPEPGPRWTRAELKKLRD